MKVTITLLFAAALAVSACAKTPSERPEDFSLSLDWNTGALPPQYHYRYVITIGPGVQGEFVYQPGYEEEEHINLWEEDFMLSDVQLDDLYAYLSNQNVMRTGWNTGNRLIGGSNTAVIINAYGKEYHIPSIAELKDADRDLVERVIDEIRSYVPQEIWDEMDARQKTHEAGFEN